MSSVLKTARPFATEITVDFRIARVVDSIVAEQSEYIRNVDIENCPKNIPLS
jgi:hypothetical protein